MSYSNTADTEHSAREKETNRKARVRTVRNVALGVLGFAAVVGTLWTGAAIDRVGDGNFAIGKSVSGIYQDQVIKQGFSVNFLTKVLEVDGKNNLVQVSDIRPKDKDGVLLEEVDLNITYNVNPDRAVSFLRSQRDMVVSDDGTYTLGKTYVTKFAQREATQVIRNFSSVSLLDSPAEVESAIQNALQKRLNKEYGDGLFEIANINLSSVTLSKVVEQRIQNIAAQDAAGAAADAQIRSLKKRTDAEIAEGEATRTVMEKTGFTFEQLTEDRRVRALEKLAATGQTQTQVTVSADRKPGGGGPG